MISLTEGISTENLAKLYADSFVSRVGDDGRAFYPVFHPLAIYLSAWSSDRFVGAYLVIRFTDFEYEAHSLLMRSATSCSRELGRLFLDWAFSNQAVLRVTGYVREDLHSAKNHCIKMGFSYEGFRRDALLVNGTPKGIHVLGITRKDWRSQ